MEWQSIAEILQPAPQFHQGEIPPRTMAAHFEALIRAMFRDSGGIFDAARLAMMGLDLVDA